MGTGEIDLLGMLDVYHNDLSLTFWPSEFDHFLKVGHGDTCNPSTGEVRSWRSLELSWCRQEVLWAMFSLALRFSSVLWMFLSSLLLAAVCDLGQDYPVSLADICLQGGGSHEDRGNKQKEWLSSDPWRSTKLGSGPENMDSVLTTVGHSRKPAETRLGIKLGRQRAFLSSAWSHVFDPCTA